MDTSGLMFPKNPPARDKGHLAYVRGELCAVYGNDCFGVTEAAHLEVAGKSIKASDFLTVPLCSVHHKAQHNLGILSFQQTYQINLWEVAARLLAKRMETMR